MFRTFVRPVSAAVCAVLLASCVESTGPGADAPQYEVTSTQPDVSAIARYQSGAPAVQFAWAKAQGLDRLETENHEDNAAMRRLNDRLGYQAKPATITLRGPLPD